MGEHEQDTDLSFETDASRDERIDNLLLDHLQRRLSGERVSDLAIIVEHKDLMPELASRLRGIAELLPPDPNATHEAAEGHADSLDPRALRVRCPHCRQSIQLASDADLNDITCSACGSLFSLVSETIQTQQAPSCKRIAQFELVQRLGLGSFGTVWKARDTELDRTVAVKIPRRGVLDPTQMGQFLREARSAAQLNHKNIVRVYEVGIDGGNAYIVSELIRGVSLADWMTGKQPTFRETATLCAQIAEALHHAHERGVVHRDLKPQNIMLDSEDEPHIMDFGLAKRESGEITMTMDGQMIGTPAYMSPEQARGEAHHADRRTDIYSLGVILFELLTGELPFRGNARMLIHQVLHDEPRHPRRLNDRIPKDLETICLKCLEKYSQKRFHSAKDAADELRRYLSGEPIQARPVSRFERGWRWCGRNRAVSSLASAVVLSLILGTLLASWQAVLAVRQRHVAEGNYYEAVMNLIRLDWEQSDIGRVQASLNDAGTYSDRGYEYFYWQRQLHRNRKTFHGHLDRVAAISVSPDGRLMATVGNDGMVKLWDIDRGIELRTLNGHTSWVRSVAFFPDGKRILTSSDDLTTRVWDIETGRERLTVQGHTACRLFAALSGDGQRIATASYDGVVRIRDSSSGEIRQTIDIGQEIWAIAYSPDGKRVVLGEESHFEKSGSARLWDLEQERALFELKHEGKIWSIEFSPNGKWIVTASTDETAKIWDANSGELIDTLLGHRGSVFSAAFSSDGEKVVTGGRGVVKVWDWNGVAAKEKAHLAGHQHAVWATAFLPGNRTLMTGSSDGMVKLWDVTMSEPRVLQHPLNVGVRSVAFVPSDDSVVSGSDDGMIRIWNSASGNLARTLPAPFGDAVTSVSVAPSGDWVVAGSEDGTAQVWDLPTGQPRFESLLKHDASVVSVCVSSDGRWIATGSGDRTVVLWNSATGMRERILSDHASGIKTVVFSPDNRHIAVNSDTTTVWNLASGRIAYKVDWPGNYYADECLAISNELLVIGGRDEWQRPKADVWDRGGRQLQFTLRGHRMSFRSGNFSPDGRRILTSSDDGTVKLWDASTGRELLTLKGHTEAVRSAVFSADGLRIATASLDGTARVWNAASPTEVAEWIKQDESVARDLDRLHREQLVADQRQLASLREDTGAVRQWLTLGPIKLTADQAEHALADTPIDEAHITPRPEEPANIYGQPLNWQGRQLEDYQFDFSSLFGPGIGRALAYSVCYVESDTTQEGVRIVTSNRGLGKIYLNGREIYKRTVSAATPLGRDTIPNLRLEAGQNVLVCKYVYRGGVWRGSLRFTDEQGNTISGVRVSLEPNLPQIGEMLPSRQN